MREKPLLIKKMGKQNRMQLEILNAIHFSPLIKHFDYNRRSVFRMNFDFSLYVTFSLH